MFLFGLGTSVPSEKECEEEEEEQKDPQSNVAFDLLTDEDKSSTLLRRGAVNVASPMRLRRSGLAPSSNDFLGSDESSSEMSSELNGGADISESKSSELVVCDSATGQCMPSPPMRVRASSMKDATIHSISVSVTDPSVKDDHRGNTFSDMISSLLSSKGVSKEDALQKFLEEDFAYSIPLRSSASSVNHAGVEMTDHDIEAAIGKSYVDLSHNHYESNALDVLALYIKGQKLLYTESKTYCEQQLNFLMLPAIFISCVGSIFSFLSGNYSSGPLIIASLNGFNAFLLSLISYLKLDAKAQAHKTSAYKFDKLESLCEFNSGRFMFFDTNVADIVNVVNKIELSVQEIKETNQFILPESIRYQFAFTYSTNVFMLVKKTHSTEMAEIHNLKNCVNYIAKLRDQLTELNSGVDPGSRTVSEKKVLKKIVDAIHKEEQRKNVIVKAIVDCRKRYFDLDEQFNREIKKHIRRSNKWFITRMCCCDWLKS